MYSMTEVDTYIKGDSEVLVNVKAWISIGLQLKKSSTAGIRRAMFYGY